MTPPRTVLVVVTRRIGDVLLATPLVRSIKSALPEARIDALVFAGTEGVLQANPDLRAVLTVPERPSASEHLALARRLRNAYDIALSVVPGDRPTLYAWLAGRWSAGLVVPGAKHAWKRWLLDAHVPFDNLDTHTVRMNLALAPLVGVAPRAEVVAAWSAADAQSVDARLAAVAGPFAVLHTFPKFNYKMWHDAGWSECAQWAGAHGMRVVLTGGPDAAEREHVARVAAQLPAALNLAGELTLAQTAYLLSRARLYVGPDTAVTHMAAAAGTPTVALFGPSNPVKWGPWPRGHTADRNPWNRVGSGQCGNVALVQGTGDCVPCLLEGCERHVASFSDCLAKLAAARVTAAAARLLDHRSGVAA